MKNENEGLVKKHDALPIVSMFYDIVPTSSISKIELVVQVDLGDRRVEKRGVVFEPDFYTQNDDLVKDINAFLQHLTSEFAGATGGFTWIDQIQTAFLYDASESLQTYAHKVFNNFSDRRDFVSEFEDGATINIDVDINDDEKCLDRRATVSVLNNVIEVIAIRKREFKKLAVVDVVKIKKNGKLVFENAVDVKTFDSASELDDVCLFDNFFLPPGLCDCVFEAHPLISYKDEGTIDRSVDELVDMYINRAIHFLKEEA